MQIVKDDKFLNTFYAVANGEQACDMAHDARDGEPAMLAVNMAPLGKTAALYCNTH